LNIGIMPIDQMTTLAWPTSLQSELRSSRPHILLLTCDEFLSKRARQAWLAMGFTASVFRSWPEAWDHLHHRELDLVILDRRTLPVQACQELPMAPEAITETTEVPVISWRRRFFHQYVLPTFSVFQLSLMQRAVEILDSR
jgi:hypothetical protein